jgi:quercetin dioxygenase-like cupin family protein
MMRIQGLEEVCMPRMFWIRRVAGAIVCVGIVVAGARGWIGHAQQPAPPAVVAAPPTGIPAEAAGFVGKTALLETTGYSIGRRIFAPGSHNATWHMHAAGQLIFAESGHGRLQIKGQPIRELAPGDSGYIPGGTMHWHGSVPTESFTMTFITMGAGPTSQGEALTEEVYLGKK